MKIGEANQLLQENMQAFGLKTIGWVGKLDNAKSRFGYCSPGEQVISLSRPLSEANPKEEVLDTILHEIAHALAYIKHGENCGHDERWKEICREIGARPEACFDSSDVNMPEAVWVLAHTETGEIFNGYQRQPKNRDFSKVWIRGRKEDTLGKLELRPNAFGKIKTFTRPVLQQITGEIIEALEEVLEKKGLTVEMSPSSFTEHEFDMKLRFRAQLPEGKTPEQAAFEEVASIFGLSSDDYYRPFQVSGKKYLLCGIKPNNRKYPIIGLCPHSEQKFKFEVEVLDSLNVAY